MSAKLRLRAAPATLVSLAAILALAVAGVVALSGTEAAAKQPKCGDTITADTTLHKDLVDCPNNGIVIGANGITLDLNGHTIDGDRKFFAPGCNPGPHEFCDVGVVNDGHDGVTLMNGSLRQFFAGTDLERMRHNRVLGISASRNHLFGIGFFRATRSLVRNNSGNGSITPDGGTGIYLIRSHHVRVLHNSFRNNGDRGMGVFESGHSLIKGNLFSRNFATAILLERSNGNRVRGNRSLRDGVGVAVLPGNRNVIARNRIAHAPGGEGRDGEGIELLGDHNLIAGNSIRVTHGNAIHMGSERSVDNVVRRNHISGAGKDGVRVHAKAKDTILRRNVVRHSKDDGLDTDSPTTKLTENRAVRNHDLGIEAVRGVIDGGGNIARHNGDPRQCTNIVCN